MKIASLTLSNFASHQFSTFRLQHRNYFVGANNVGKSSVISAIRWCLTGKAPGIDGRNTDVADLITDGATKELSVVAEIDGFGSVMRSTDGRDVTLKVKDWTGSTRAQLSALYDKGIRATEELLLACMGTTAFLSLHHHDAKRLLFGVLDVRIPADMLKPLGLSGPLDLDDLDRQYQIAFDERTRAKNRLEAHPAYPLPEGDEPPSVQELTDQLEAVRQTERRLLSEAGEARGRHDELGKAITDLEAEERTIDRRIKAAGDPHAELDRNETEIKKLPPETPPAPAADLFSEPPAPVLSPAETEAGEIRTSLVDYRGRLRLLADTIVGIDGHDPAKGCVLNRDVPCKTPIKEFTGRIDAARKDADGLRASIGEAEKRLQGLEAAITTERAAAAKARQADATARAAESRARARRDELNRQRAALTLKASNLQADTERIGVVRTNLAAKRVELEALGPVQAPAELVAVQSRIKRGETIVTEARQWHEAKQRHDDAEAAGAHLVEEVARLEALVAKLGPKGLVLDVLEAARERFETAVNAALSKWGYVLQFQFDPWVVLVNGRKSIRLSESEQLRVGVALQLAIAEISGLGFASIDRVDMLDGANRALLADVIEGFDGQLIMAATKDPDFIAPAELPDDTAFFVLALEDSLTQVLVGTD